MTIIKIKTAELAGLLGAEIPQFPKYVSQIINLANQNAQGTRPKIVGQMSELVSKSGSKSIREWEEWYKKSFPEALDRASSKIWAMVKLLKEAMNKIDRNIVEQWVEDLVIVKTFMGLNFQEAVLKKISEMTSLKYRLSNSTEESRGIDGWIGETPVSIKPDTYKVKNGLSEIINAEIIFYSKKKDGIVFEVVDIFKFK